MFKRLSYTYRLLKSFPATEVWEIVDYVWEQDVRERLSEPGVPPHQATLVANLVVQEWAQKLLPGAPRTDPRIRNLKGLLSLHHIRVHRHMSRTRGKVLLGKGLTKKHT